MITGTAREKPNGGSRAQVSVALLAMPGGTCMRMAKTTATLPGMVPRRAQFSGWRSAAMGRFPMARRSV